MSPLRFILLTLALCGTVGSATLIGNVIGHVLIPPTVYVLPEVEIEVPVIDRTTCVELLAAEVAQPASDCNSCHTGGTSTAFREFTVDDFVIEIAPDNHADEDTGGGIRRDRWIPGEATGL